MIALAASLLACAGTLALFALVRRGLARRRAPAWANPVLLTAALLASALAASAAWQGRSAAFVAAGYERLTQPLLLLLQVAVAALALPIARAAPLLARHGWRLPAVVAAGALVGSVSAVIGARLLGLGGLWERALSTKSVSSPFAITVNSAIAGAPELAAGVSVVTGVVGALLLPPLLRALRVDGDLAIGLATGQAAHVVGTEALARARPAAAPFAALALALAGLITALALPPLWRWSG